MEKRMGRLSLRRNFVCGVFIAAVFVMALAFGAARAATVTDFAGLQTALGTGGEIVLNADITVTETLEIASNVTLTGARALTLAQGVSPMFHVAENAALTVKAATLAGAPGKEGTLIQVDLGASVNLDGQANGTVTLTGADIGVEVMTSQQRVWADAYDYKGGAVSLIGEINIAGNTKNVLLAGVSNCYARVPQGYTNFIRVTRGTLKGRVGISFYKEPKELGKLLFVKQDSFSKPLTWNDAQVFFYDADPTALPARGGYMLGATTYEQQQRGRWLRFEKSEEVGIIVYGGNGSDFTVRNDLNLALRAAVSTKWDSIQGIPNCQEEMSSGTSYVVLRGEGPYTLNGGYEVGAYHKLHILARQEAEIKTGSGAYIYTASQIYGSNLKIGGGALGMTGAKINFSGYGNNLVRFGLDEGGLEVENIAGGAAIRVSGGNERDRALTVKNSRVSEVDMDYGTAATKAVISDVNMENLILEPYPTQSGEKAYDLKLTGTMNIAGVIYPDAANVVCPDMREVTGDSQIGLSVLRHGRDWENPFYAGLTAGASPFLRVVNVDGYADKLYAFVVENGWIYAAEGVVYPTGTDITADENKDKIRSFRFLKDAVAAANEAAQAEMTVGIPWSAAIKAAETIAVSKGKHITLTPIQPYSGYETKPTREISKAESFAGESIFDVSGELTLHNVIVKGNCAVREGGVVGTTDIGEFKTADLYGGTLAVESVIYGLQLNLKADYQNGALLNSAGTDSVVFASDWEVYDEFYAEKDDVRICSLDVSATDIKLKAVNSSVVMSVYEGDPKKKTAVTGYKTLVDAYDGLWRIMQSKTLKTIEAKIYLRDSEIIPSRLSLGEYGYPSSVADVELIARDAVTLTYTDATNDTMLPAQNKLTLTGQLTIKDTSGKTRYSPLITARKLTLNEGVTITGFQGGSYIIAVVRADEIVVNGATITGNVNTNGPAALRAGKVTLNGGTITGNQSKQGFGAVQIIPGGALNVSGTVNISGNTLTDGATPANVTGAVTIAGALSENAAIGITTNPGDGVVARGTSDYQITEADLARLSSDEGKLFTLVDGVVKVSLGEGALTAYDKDGVEVANLTTVTEALQNASVVTVQLNKDITQDISLTVPAGKTVRLMGNKWDFGANTLTNKGIVEGPGMIVGTISDASAVFINGASHAELTYPIELERGGAVTTYNTLKNALEAAKEGDKAALNADFDHGEYAQVPAGVTLEIPRGITLSIDSGYVLTEVKGTLTGAGTVNINGIFVMGQGSTLGDDIHFKGDRPLGVPKDMNLDDDLRFVARVAYNVNSNDGRGYFSGMSGAGIYSGEYSTTVYMLRDVAAAGAYVGSSYGKTSVLDLQGHTLTIVQGGSFLCENGTVQNGTIVNRGKVWIMTAGAYENITWSGGGTWQNISKAVLENSGIIPIAQAGTSNLFYCDLDSAVNWANTSDRAEIKLLKDAVISQTLTCTSKDTYCKLDLNGHTLTITDTGSIAPNANWTIIASTSSNLTVEGLCGLLVNYSYTPNITLTGNGGVKTAMGDHVIIKDGYYYPLTYALDAAQPGETVTFNTNITIAEGKTVAIPEGVTLACAGKGGKITNKGTLKIDGVLSTDRLALDNTGGTITGLGTMTKLDQTNSKNVPAFNLGDTWYLSHDAGAPNQAIANSGATVSAYAWDAEVTLDDSIVIPEGKKVYLQGRLSNIKVPEGKPLFVVESGGTLSVGSSRVIEGSAAVLPFLAEVKSGGAISVSASDILAGLGKIRLGEGCAVRIYGTATSSTANPIATLSLADPSEYQAGRMVLECDDREDTTAACFRFAVDDVNYKVNYNNNDKYDYNGYLAVNNNLQVTIEPVTDPAITTRQFTGAAIDVRELFTVAPDGANIAYALVTGVGALEETKLYPSQAGDFAIQARFGNKPPVTGTLTVTRGQPAAPAAPAMASRSDESVTLEVIPGAEYKMEQGDWRDSSEFTGLEAAKAYTFTARIKLSSLMDESSPSEPTTISTLAEAPKEGEGYAVNYIAETLSIEDSYEAFADQSLTTPLTGNAAVPGAVFYIRKAAKDATPASGARAVTLPSRPAKPTATAVNMVGAAKGAINGVDAAMEYKKQGGVYANVTSASIEITEPGAYLVRVAATDNAFSGLEQELTIGKCALEVTAPKFEAAVYGYAQPAAQGVSVKNIGDAAAHVTGASLTGTAFILTGTSGTVAGGASDATTWTVRPAANLNADGYKETLTLTYDGGATASREISFTVNRAVPTYDLLAFAPPYNLAAGDAGKEATLTANTGVTGLGEVTVEYYDGTAKLDAAPTREGNYTVKAAVAEGGNYLAATLENSAWAYVITKDKQAISLSVKTQPNLVYLAGEAPDMSALAVTIAYNDGTSADVSYAAFGEAFTLTLWDGTVGVGLPANLTLADNAKCIRLTKGELYADTSPLAVAQPVAKIGDKLFATLARALLAAQTDEIELLNGITRDAELTVEANQNVVLKMDGYTLKLPTITVNGTLKLMGGGTVFGKILNYSPHTVYIDGVWVTGGVESHGGRVVIEAVPAGGITIVMTDPNDSVELGDGVTLAGITVKTGMDAQTATEGVAAAIGSTLYFSAQTALTRANPGETVALGEKASVASPVTVADGITINTSDAPANLLTGNGAIKGKSLTYETATLDGLKAAADAAGADDTVKVTGNVTLDQKLEIKGDLEVTGELNTGDHELTVDGELNGTVRGDVCFLIAKGALVNGNIRLHERLDDTDLWGMDGAHRAKKGAELRVSAQPENGYVLDRFTGATFADDGTFTVTSGATIGAVFTANAPSAGPTPTPAPEERPVSGVKLSPATLEMKIGEKAALIATVEPPDAANKQVVWTCADERVVTVKDGVVTAVAPGQTRITVTTLEGGFSARCEVTVVESEPQQPEDTDQPVANMDVLALRKGRTFPLERLVRGFEGDWSVGDAAVASVSRDGQRVKTLKKGETTLTFRVREAKSGAKYLGKTTLPGEEIRVKLYVVSEAREAAKIKLSESNLTLAPGESALLKAEVTPAKTEHKQVFWQSGNEKVFTVDAKGKVTAVGKGKAELTATTTSGKTKRITVTVSEEIVELTLNAGKKTLKKGERFELTLKSYLPASLEKPSLIWRSSKPKIARVDETGEVTAIKKGKTIITATAPNGAKVSCKITVK